ncbi:MAG: T9SS type A sorting domain-containing protein [Candidatus Kapaibacterium sp.]
MKKGKFFAKLLQNLLMPAILGSLVSAVSAQTSSSGINSDGRDFYIGYIQPSYNAILQPYALTFFQSYALVSSYTDCKISVAYFDDATGAESVEKVYPLAARTGIQISLDRTKMKMDEPGDIPQFRACHITSDHPINVQYFSTGPDGSGSYLALATPALGKRYVVASYNDNPGIGAVAGSGIDTSDGVFLIIAPFDNTTVKITPNASTKGGHAGMHSGANANGAETPYSVNLRRGQCYFVKSGSSESEVDISGSLVESDRPVAVLGGQENATIGTTDLMTEARDFMVEEMMPIDFLDTIGYVSIPLKDSQPADPSSDGAGDNYRVYTFDPAGSKVVMNEAGIGERDLATGRMSYPVPEMFGVTGSVELHSTNGKNFSVMLYDQRNQLSKPPYPAPSMMTIVPMSRWKKSFSWYVPLNLIGSDPVNLHQFYVNIIASEFDLDAINISFNGGGLKPLKQLLTADQTFRDIPGNSSVVGARFAVQPGSYYAVCQHPFMIYNYSYQGVGNSKHVPPGPDEWYSSTADPAGASLSSGDSGMIGSVVGPFKCTEWNVCVTDNRKTDPGIRSVTLLDDALGVQFYPGKESFNCHLDPAFDPQEFGEVELDGKSASLCFNVLIDDILSPAYGAVLVTDNAGNKKLIELHYDQPKLTVSESDTGNIFHNLKIGSDTCFSISLKNLDTALQTVNSVSLGTAGGFRLTSVLPALPVKLHRGDSVTMKVCFAPRDTLVTSDSLDLVFDCFTLPIELSGNGTTGLINATDANFGSMDTGLSTFRSISLKNIGTSQFTLTKNWSMTGSSAFNFTVPTFPVTLQPGATQNVTVIYVPKTVSKDTAVIHWTSDIAAPYTQSVKSYSVLTGEGLAVASSVASSPTSTLSIRPNPASGNGILLTLGSLSSDMAEIHIFDLLGREMWKKNIPSQETQSQIEIPIGNLQNGIYYARVSAGGKTVTEKFEVMR